MNNATAIINECSIEDVRAIELPTKTESYMPVGHEEVINYVTNELAPKLSQFKMVKNTFGLSNKGQYLFGMATFSNGDKYMGPSIAYRNSYNKEFALGFAFGSQVFVCANGMFTGDIIVAKKHTKNVWASVRELMDERIGDVDTFYRTLQDDVSRMKQVELTNEDAWKLLGQLRGEDVLSPRVFEKALKEWHTPSHEEHKDGTSLQLYNACTEALKLETLPSRAMTQRIALHDAFQSEVIDGMYHSK